MDWDKLLSRACPPMGTRTYRSAGTFSRFLEGLEEAEMLENVDSREKSNRVWLSSLAEAKDHDHAVVIMEGD